MVKLHSSKEILIKMRRRLEIDVAKGCGVGLVIIGHMTSFVPHEIISWIYSFHMPLFFIITGFFAKKSSKDELKSVILKDIKNLLVPYYLFSFIFILIGLITGEEIGSERIKDVLLGNGGIEVLWFLFALCGIKILFNILQVVLSNDKALLITNISLVILGYMFSLFNCDLPFKIGSIFYAIGFYYLGYLLKNQSIRVRAYLEKRIVPCIIISVIGWSVLSCLSKDNLVLDVNNNYCVDIVLNYIVAFAGTYIVLFVSEQMKKVKLLLL